jgi:Uncharacterized protein conserved in bacteria (DUF2188)
MARQSSGGRDVVKEGSQWAWKKPGSREPESTHRTQAEAERAAKKQVLQEGGGETRMHTASGQIRDSDTIGKKDLTRSHDTRH